MHVCSKLQFSAPPPVKIGEGEPPALLLVCIHFRHLLIFHPDFLSLLKVSLELYS